MLDVETTLEGSSNGGAHTTTETSYEEHTVTNGEAFFDEESWSTATAVDSAHAADLWFTYQVSNEGHEYAREICDLSFNVYIGDADHPAYTYFVGPDVGGDGCFNTFMPGEDHEYTAHRIPLTLEQMKAVDLGGPVRIVVEDYTYGIDELFYEDAVNANVQLAIEDGTSDDDEAIDNYLIPTWGEETVLDVLGRYFPHETDADGNLTAVWTAEHRTDAPSWCQEPRRVGATTWCKHALSTAEWWNIYTDGLGDGSEGFQETSAVAGSTALFRFNKDSDFDGYSDRSEVRLGTDPSDPTSHPEPELMGGTHSVRERDHVTATLSLLNTGFHDAYGVEAVMLAPNDSISVTNNTVGGSGRVRALKDVVVGSRITDPSYDASTWQGAARPFSAGYYGGEQDRVYSFTAMDAGEVSTGTLRLSWNDGEGASGTLDVGDGYASPTPVDVGSHGVELGMVSGEIQVGDTFTVAARTPQDTFQYTINREPYSEPVVLVSYNDPQGNHRFITPITLTHPTDNLVPHGDQMRRNLSAEIVTRQPITTVGRHTTSVVTNWPAEVTLEDAHLFLQFVNITGTVASEVSVTTTMEPGPTVVPVEWSTDAFSPPFQMDQDYTVMAFWADWQGNIIDTAARPLSSFQVDPKPVFAMDAADATWDFGTAAQGTLLKRRITLANTGRRDLLVYVDAPSGVNVSGSGSRRVGPADVTTYEVALDTTGLPTGPYETTITIRTSDPDSPVQTVQLTGTITSGTPDADPGTAERPLDWDAYIAGEHSQGEWVQFTHTLGPDPQTLHPVKAYSADYGILWGVGAHALPWIAEASGNPLFGDGSDGDLVVGSTAYVDDVRSALASTADAGDSQIALVNADGFAASEEVLIIQMRGSGDGTYEFGTIADKSGNTVTLAKPLGHGYTVGGDSRAQVFRVPHYRDVTVPSGKTLTCHSWNGNTGGVVAFRASGRVQIDGELAVTGLGYRGGDRGELGDTVAAHGWQGESRRQTGAQSRSQQYGAGGGGQGDNHDRNVGAGGGGGAYGGAGQNGQSAGDPTSYGGSGGAAYGSSDLTSQMHAGAGGGGGGSDDNNSGPGGYGGAGGGVIVVIGREIDVGGSIVADGDDGARGSEAHRTGGGGGGAGGAILIKGSEVGLGSGKVHALGGLGADGTDSYGSDPDGGDGGDGGVGRIHVQYCTDLTGSTSPAANTDHVSCHIIEQIESSPYDSARLNLPESFTGGRHYMIQYGRRHVFSGPAEWDTTLRVPAGGFTDASLDALISEVGNGDLTLRLDIGGDGSWDWVSTQAVANVAAFDSPDLSDAFNAYWAAQGAPLVGTLDVPVTVYLSKAGQVLLTDFQMTPTGSRLRHVRLSAQDYGEVTLDLTVGEAGSDPVTVAADVGDDGTADWTHSGSGAYSVQLTTDDLSAAFNAYLDGRSGEADVPIRFYVAPFVPLALHGFSATRPATVDAEVSDADVAFGATSSVEGDTVSVSATLHNAGGRDMEAVSVAFYATAPEWGDWFIGADYLPAIPAGGTGQATIQGETLGFSGEVPVRLVVDPYERVAETDESNNQATATYDIRARQGLKVFLPMIIRDN